MGLNRWVFGVLGLWMLAGCDGGNGDGNGGGAVSTGLPASQVLGEVTTDQAEDLCEALRDTARSAISEAELQRFTCTFAALAISAQVDEMGQTEVDRMACEAAVDDCLQQPGEVTETDNCTSSSLMTALMDCDATAEELEACLNASISGIRSLLARIDCGADLTMEPSGGGFEEPAQCTSFNMKCPGVLDAVGDATETLPAIDMGSGGSAGSGGQRNEGPGGCSDTCGMVDGFCDDGGEDSDFPICPFGTDCTDCGPRP